MSKPRKKRKYELGRPPAMTKVFLIAVSILHAFADTHTHTQRERDTNMYVYKHTIV